MSIFRAENKKHVPPAGFPPKTRVSYANRILIQPVSLFSRLYLRMEQLLAQGLHPKSEELAIRLLSRRRSF